MEYHHRSDVYRLHHWSLDEYLHRCNVCLLPGETQVAVYPNSTYYRCRYARLLCGHDVYVRIGHSCGSISHRPPTALWKGHVSGVLCQSRTRSARWGHRGRLCSAQGIKCMLSGLFLTWALQGRFYYLQSKAFFGGGLSLL